mgnify:CR=1 FL=1
MNLAFEYLLRHDLTKQFLKLPCSIFMAKSAKRPQKQSRIAVSIFERDDRYSIKRWDLTECEKDQALPPMEEIYVDDVIGEFKKIIPRGYRPISYIQGSIPNQHNHWRKPMTAELYNEFFNRMLNSAWHRRWRIVWLWQTFVSVYFESSDQRPQYAAGTHIDEMALKSQMYPVSSRYMDRDMKVMSIEEPRYYAFWTKWKDHITFPSASPGELVFSDPQSYFAEMKKYHFPPLDRFRMPKFKKHAPVVPDPPPNPTPPDEATIAQLLKTLMAEKEKVAKKNPVPEPDDWAVEIMYPMDPDEGY